MTEQDFYEHIAKNYTSIKKYCQKFLKEESKDPDHWDKENNRWFPEVDIWDGFDEYVDLNFWTDCPNNEFTNPEDEVAPIMVVTAYLYQNNAVCTDIYLRVYRTTGKK